MKNSTIYTTVDSPTKNTGINTRKITDVQRNRSMENMNKEQKITQEKKYIYKPNRTHKKKI